jgi:hypothetical protein
MRLTLILLESILVRKKFNFFNELINKFFGISQPNKFILVALADNHPQVLRFLGFFLTVLLMFVVNDPE